MALTNVLRPIRINQVEVKNRIFRSGHGTYYGKGGISDRLIAYHEARAKAGVGLTTLEVAVVHPSSASNATVYAWDDAIIDGFKRISKMAHNHGMALFTQLWHGGHHWPPVDGTPAWGPSVTPSPWGFVPLEMDHEKIATITKAFADAAVRARAGGLDGVELHFGHGYLIHQFFSPLINVREDEYGGSLANRMRFGAEVLRAVRKEVGTDFAVGIRISDQHTPDGLSVSECAEIVRAYCAEKLVDFVNGSMGSYHDVPSMLPAMDAPVGAMMPSAGPIVAAADVVRMVAGRFQTLEDADEIIRSGQADMVAIVRGMIADPDLVAKSVAGKAEDVRPCIACNQGCVGGILGPDPGIRCTVNAVVGMEATLGEHLITKSAMPKKVVVVGGGPSGLEAARLAATAGHKVVLFEATNKLGGSTD
jgi:2,4-dienoyl-CoA reductase-like NADH-dependent reductase (Old Yellow Enzyme family)